VPSSNAVNIVKQDISTLKGDNAAKDWFCWSLHMDGPIFFKVPSPIGFPIDHNDPKYQVSGRIFNILQPLIVYGSFLKAACFLVLHAVP
jgi:hypothetical protein